jgi:hypothetical protein
MKLFNNKGMMLFPNPIQKSKICQSKNLLVVNNCYCHNGHDLINENAVFNGFKGLMLLACRGDQKGLVALSPVYGYKSRVSINLTFNSGEVWDVCCPLCKEKLPVFSPCSCGGDLFTLFLDQSIDYSNSILICNRIDCFNAEMKYNNQLVHYSGVDVVI